MDWIQNVQLRLRRKNQILFAKQDTLFHELTGELAVQSHRAAVLWALELAEEAVCILEKQHPDDSRPRNALEAARLWAAGKIKMPEAQRTILRCHAAAKDSSDAARTALCHAVGQACSVVHTKGHAMGFPIYELTAFVRQYGLEVSRIPIEKRGYDYTVRLRACSERAKTERYEWAAFIKE